MTVLGIDQLREEMESGSCSDGAFRYDGTEYYFGHDFSDGTYHFGVLNTVDTDREFKSFDDIMNAKLVGDKPFREMLPLVKWY